jgi:hypothetical protein
MGYADSDKTDTLLKSLCKTCQTIPTALFSPVLVGSGGWGEFEWATRVALKASWPGLSLPPTCSTCQGEGNKAARAQRLVLAGLTIGGGDIDLSLGWRGVDCPVKPATAMKRRRRTPKRATSG